MFASLENDEAERGSKTPGPQGLFEKGLALKKLKKLTLSDCSNVTVKLRK